MTIFKNNILKNNLFHLIFSAILLVLPFALVSGPALPDILITFTAIFFLACLYIYKIKIDYKILTSFMLFWFTLMLSSLISNYTLFSLKSSTLYIRFFLFFLFFIYVYDFNKNFLLTFFIIFNIIISFLIIDSTIQYFTGFNLLNYEMYQSRASSLFKDELILGNFFYLFFPVSFFYIFKSSKFSFLSKFTFFIMIFVFIILITGERIIFLKSLILIIILGTFLLNLRLKIILAIIVTPILIVFLNIPNFKDRFINDFSLRLGINTERTFLDSHWGAIYLTSFELFKNNVFLGIGPNNYRNECNLPDIKDIKEYVDIDLFLRESSTTIEKLSRDKKFNLRFKNNLEVTNYQNYIFIDAFNIIKNNNEKIKTEFFIIDKSEYIDGYYGSDFLPYDINGKLIQEPIISSIEYKNRYNINSYSFYLACSTHPHNLTIQLLTETGIFGYLTFLLLVTSLFFLLFKYKSKDNLIFYYIGVGYLLNLVNPLFTYSNFFNNNTNSFFWFSILLVFIIMKSTKQNNAI